MRASAERCVRVLGTTMAMENPSREPHIVQVRGDFRIDVYERPVQLTLGSLSLEAQRELLLLRGFSPFRKLMSGHANPDEETTDWRAVCGRTACTVRRAGRARALSDPY